MKEPLTGNIDFLLTIDTTNGQRTFNATLKNIEGEFRIYLHSDSAITWDNEISFFTFGENLKTENAQINGTEIELDLSKAKLITMQTQTIISSKVNIFYFIIDTYQYRYIDTSVPNKALSYSVW